MSKTTQRYLNSEAHGCLMEAEACKALLKELERIQLKLKRRIDKEAEERQAAFEAAVQYHSENAIQDDYGWGVLTEKQYELYLDLFRRGQQALDEHNPTISELALSILNRIFRDIEKDLYQYRFEALTPEQRLAELQRAQQSKDEWDQHIAELKARINVVLLSAPLPTDNE